MQRVRIQRPGGHEVLRVETVPTPGPGPGQVLVEVAACGVNYADAIIRMGLYASAKVLHGYPITPGFEVAGQVVAVGPGCSTRACGDRVMALVLFGGYASHVVVEESATFPVPPALDLQQAAGLPTVFLTAWYMVHRQVHPEAGDRWLVHSAAGGVGSALVQLGRLAGCHVTGVVGAAHKRDHARAMGADEVLVGRDRTVWHQARCIAPDGFNAVFDANGVRTLADSYAHLAPTGVLAVYGFHSMLPRSGRVNWLRLAWDWLRTPRFSPLDMTRSNRSVVAANLSFLQAHADRLSRGMAWLLERFADGRLQPLPVEAFPLREVAAAHRRIESGQTLGKLVLVPEREPSH